MKGITLKARLLRYLKNNPTWIASGAIQRLVADKTSYTPQNVGRRLRELTEGNLIEVDYRQNHAYYRFKAQNASEAIVERNSRTPTFDLQTTLFDINAYFEAI